jgi:hypothetical protein
VTIWANSIALIPEGAIPLARTGSAPGSGHAPAGLRVRAFRSEGFEHRRGLTGPPRRPTTSTSDAVKEVPFDHVGLRTSGGGPHGPETVDVVSSDRGQGLAACRGLGPQLREALRRRGLHRRAAREETEEGREDRAACGGLSAHRCARHCAR